MADGEVQALRVHGGLARLVPAQGNLSLAAAQTAGQHLTGQQLASHGALAVILAGDVADAAAALLVHHGHRAGHGLLVQLADIVPKQFHFVPFLPFLRF